MERGSLFWVLRNDVEAKELTWKIRVSIIIGIANALSYMHHDFTQSIVHRDITSSNILLNSELEACVVDFGLVRFVNPDSSNRTILASTYGYMAPGNFFSSILCFYFLQKIQYINMFPLIDNWLSNENRSFSIKPIIISCIRYNYMHEILSLV